MSTVRSLLGLSEYSLPLSWSFSSRRIADNSLGRGESLLNYLDHLPLIDRKNNAPLMMPISEKYADMGCVVVGKVESGHVKKGQNLLLMPNKVRQILSLSLFETNGCAD